MVLLLFVAALAGDPAPDLRIVCPRELTEPCFTRATGAPIPGPPPAPRDLRLEPYLRADETLPLILGGAAIDAWTALDLMERREARELNPLGGTPEKILAIQFAHSAGAFAAVHIVDRRYGRKAGRRTLVGLTILKVAIAGLQLTQGR